jgi:ribose 5-phosphate isomerase A
LTITLNMIPGVVENGLFVKMADTIIIGSDNGSLLKLIHDKG